MGATTDVLGVCEMVVLMVVELVREEITLDKLDTGITGSVEHTGGAEKGGNTAPPSIWPFPGKMLAGATTLV